jgi:hypothetical protein
LPAFDLLDDLILLSRVLQFGLILKIEGSLRIVGDIHGHLIPDGAGHVHDDLFIEGEGRHAAQAFIDIGIVLLAQVETKDQLRTSRRNNVDHIGSEELVKGLSSHLDGGNKGELLFQGGSAGFQPPVFVYLLPEFIFLILFPGHQGGIPVIPAADGFGKNIFAGQRIINDLESMLEGLCR